MVSPALSKPSPFASTTVPAVFSNASAAFTCSVAKALAVATGASKPEPAGGVPVALASLLISTVPALLVTVGALSPSISSCVRVYIEVQVTVVPACILAMTFVPPPQSRLIFKLISSTITLVKVTLEVLVTLNS